MIALKDFEETGALLTGHFRLSSGLHSDRYLQCARLLLWPPRAEAAGRELAERVREFSPGLVFSTALGGIIIGHETARALGLPFLFAERHDGALALRRGFRLEPGERVAVVEDVLTTGRSTKEVIRIATDGEAEVVAVGSIVDRGLPQGTFSVPTRSLLSLDVPAWQASQCPLCFQGIPIDAPGSRYAKT